MPTPLGHSLAGFALYFGSRGLVGGRLGTAALAVVLANLPDIDFLPGYLSNDPRSYHWGPTHSLAAALLVGALLGWWGRRHAGRFMPAFAFAATIYASHILLDLLLGPGPAPSIGLQVLWPFSNERLLLPWSVFRMAPSSIETIGPIRALFSRDIMPVIAREALVLVPTVLAAWAFARRRNAMARRAGVASAGRILDPEEQPS